MLLTRWGWLRTALKRALWSVAFMLALLAAAAGAWLASNWRDVPTQAWPQALTGPASELPDSENLYVALQQVPLGKGSLALDACVDAEGAAADCAQVWRAQRPQWAKQRVELAAFGTACEAHTSAGGWQYQDPLPDPARPLDLWAMHQPVMQCAALLQTRAIDASEAGDGALALRWLTQSHRLVRAMWVGSRTLVGHTLALSMLNRQLHIVQMVVAQHSSQAAALVAVAEFPAADLASAQRSWISSEAQLNRSLMAQLATPQSCGEDGFWDHAVCRLWQRTALPNFAVQLSAANWLTALEAIDPDDPTRVVQQQSAVAQAGPNGLFGSIWHWRGTVPHILFGVAQPGYRDYFERGAQAVLAAQATQLWLQAGAQGVPVQQQSAWLADRLAGTPLATRLRVKEGGTWQLLDDVNRGGSVLSPWRWLPLPPLPA